MLRAMSTALSGSVQMCGLPSRTAIELTFPRSPTISVAIAAYVVSEVTTLTGAAVRAAGTVPSCKPRMSKRIVVSMSVCLVFMRSDGPDYLERELIGRVRTRQLLPLILTTQEHPLALPHRERRNDLSCDFTKQG